MSICINYLISILCRENTLHVKMLHKYLQQNNMNVIVVTDQPAGTQKEGEVAYNDETLINENFNYMTLHTSKHPTSWDKAFYHIYKNKLSYDYYYFIEDDVYCNNLQIFVDLIKTLESYPHDLVSKNIASRDDDPTWQNWHRKDLFERAYRGVDDPLIYRSYDPFCRLSKKLVDKVFEFYDTYHRLYFHEMIFATLCMKNKLKYIDWGKDETLKQFFGPFLYIGPKSKHLTKYIKCDKICHPKYSGG